MANNNYEENAFHAGKRITYFREQKKLSTNRLANLAGVSQSYLRDVELGNKNPTVEFITLLCKALGISLAEFFSEDTTSTLINDPLIMRIYRLTPKQRKALLAFLDTI